MTLQIRLAVRDWDYIVPLALGDVVAEGLDLRIDRVPALPRTWPPIRATTPARCP